LLQRNPLTACADLIPSDGDLAAVHVEDVRRQCPHIILSRACPEDMIFDFCAESYIGDLNVRGRQLVGFFRQPEIRIVSDWLPSAHRPGATPRDKGDIGQFALSRQGCAVKMLTRPAKLWGDGNHCDDGLEPTWDEVDQAVLRLRNEYAFIGMTDAWDLSICLFNAMSGNPCHADQFSSYTVHTTSLDSSDTSMLNEWVDPYDAILWGVAQQVFEENLHRFNVSEENCQPCNQIV